jgi:hypothetical protein
MMKPLAIDIFCGLGGWTEGFMAEGYEVVGFDIERHVYGSHQYPAQLVLQDALTLHGSQFRDAAVIVASSPCQAYSYMAMPWTRAKQIARALRGQDEFPEGYTGYRTIAELNALFEAPKRIQREACEAAGRFIPMIQENVRGAIPWVGRSQWNFGSYHLWGDVPAMMPIPHKATKLGGGASWYPPTDPRHQPGLDFTRLAAAKQNEAHKGSGGSWFGVSPKGERQRPNNPARGANIGEGVPKFETERETVSEEGRKVGGDWFGKGCNSPMRLYSSKSPARKAASAKIAKIPYPLASHIARVYYPRTEDFCR